jgi:hypothetical protein
VRNQGLQPQRLFLQTFGGCRALFDQGCILLRGHVQFTYGTVYFVGAISLCTGRPVNRRDHLGPPLQPPHHIMVGLAGRLNPCRPGRHLAPAVIDQLLDLLDRGEVAVR